MPFDINKIRDLDGEKSESYQKRYGKCSSIVSFVNTC